MATVQEEEDVVMALPAATLPELFFKQVERLGDSVALRRKDMGIWNEITWREYGSFVEIVAAGMAALGVNPGDRIAVLGENRPEWLYCHLGCMSVAAPLPASTPLRLQTRSPTRLTTRNRRYSSWKTRTGGQSSTNNRQPETQQGRRMGTKGAVGIYS